jgi:hypothetical protein
MYPERDTCAEPTPNNYAHLSTRRTAEAGQTCHGRITRRCAKPSGGVLRTFDKTREKPTVAGRFEDTRPVHCRARTPLIAPCSSLLKRSTSGGFCPTPGAKLSQFRPTTTHKLASHKRLARAAWGEIRRVSPTRKRKNIAEAKTKNLHPRLRTRRVPLAPPVLLLPGPCGWSPESDIPAS